MSVSITPLDAYDIVVVGAFARGMEALKVLLAKADAASGLPHVDHAAYYAGGSQRAAQGMASMSVAQHATTSADKGARM